MKIRYLLPILLLTTCEAFCSPYWVATEDDQFLKDKAGFSEFTLSYYSFEIRFQKEERYLIATKRFSLNKADDVAEQTTNELSEKRPVRIAYIYDNNNRLIEERLVVNADFYFTMETYEYRGKQRVAKSFMLLPSNTVELLSQENVTTDDQGRKTEDTSFDKDGKVTSSFRYVYEDDKTTLNYYDSDGKLLSQNITYLANGKPQKREDYDSGTLSQTLVYSYSPDGQLENEKLVSPGGDTTFQELYQYDGDRLVSTDMIYSDQPERRIEYTYDGKGRLASVKSSLKVKKFGQEYYESEYLIERIGRP